MKLIDGYKRWLRWWYKWKTRAEAAQTMANSEVHEKSWEIHEKVMRKPQESQEEVMKKSWETHEKVKRKSQESHDKVMRNS